MPKVRIEDVLWFSGNNGTILDARIVRDWILNGRGAELVQAIEMAEQFRKHRYLRDADCGSGDGPLARYNELEFSEFLEIVETQSVLDAQAATNTQVKREASFVRRKEFDRKRSALVLAMLERGDDYICSQQGCESADDLTVDHIVPLSKGGTDELSNLQFLCRYHNSKKSDKMIEVDE